MDESLQMPLKPILSASFTHNKILSMVIVGFLLLGPYLYANANANINENYERQLNYQQAAPYTHLQWDHITRPTIQLQINPLVNESGIPMEDRLEKPEYFYHGKLPAALDSLVNEAFAASHLFAPQSSQPEYVITLILDEYQLPFEYAPDDIWWQKLHQQTDRWLQPTEAVKVRMTIKVSGAIKPIKTWMDSVEIQLSECDLNQFPQPAVVLNSNYPVMRTYLSTSPGQAFLAATNFLILQAAQHLQQQAPTGRITKLDEQEIHLHSEAANFVVGDVLQVFYQQSNGSKAMQAAGSVQVIHTRSEGAIAYPVTLRADHLRSGDWVELKSQSPMQPPSSSYTATTQCASVSTADTQGISENSTIR